MDQEKLRDISSFRFGNLHPNLFMGTASDRYAGWMGQIYSERRFGAQIIKRSRKLGGKTFREELLPVESVEEYFDHFPILELDFTFYLPLLDREGRPTRAFHLLHSYNLHLGDGDGLILKAPRDVTARKIFRRGAHVGNEDYLNPGLFARQFYRPAKELLGARLRGIILEQEYQRKEERISPVEHAGELDRFFRAVPPDARFHLELRTEAFLREPVFRVLETHGIGQVLSHWTWLPSLSRQFALSGKRFFNKTEIVIRLMTPRGMRYEDAYARAHPFNRLIKGMQTPGMVEDTARLIKTGLQEGMRVNVIINNRAGGNAPLLARQIANEFISPRGSEG